MNAGSSLWGCDGMEDILVREAGGETRAGSSPVIFTAVRLRPDFSFGLRKKSEKRRNFLKLQFKT